MTSSPKIVLITLGEELLLGLTKNGHLTYVGKALRDCGITLHAQATITDTPEDIREYFADYWEKADILITTGGLGPTVDDRTKEVIAEALGETLVFDESILANIEERFRSMGKPMSENNRKLAYRFRHAELLENPHGTAPGLWLEKNGKLLVMLPGPPRELHPMFEEQVLPRLRHRGILADKESYLQIRTAGVGESTLETMLQPVLSKHQGVEIAYCAHQGQVDFRLSFAESGGAYDRLIELSAECRNLLGDDFVCTGHSSMIKVVSDILRQKKHTLAVAESCTGGMLSNEFTNLAGSSSFFLGGLTTYSNGSKSDLLNVPEEMIQQHTPVSAEVSMAMVTGVAERLEADYAISTTGYAGPSGGTKDDPVGTVYIGLHSPKGVWVKRFFFRGNRESIKTRACGAAVDWLRRTLIAEVQDEVNDLDDLREESQKIIRSLK